MLPTVNIVGSFSNYPSGFAGGAGFGHIYWRIINITVPLSLLEFSEIALFIGGVDQNPLVLEHTAFTGPDVAGSEGFAFNSNVADRLVYNQATVQASNFYFRWKFSEKVVVDGVKQGFYDTDGRHISAFTLQFGDNDVDWTTLGSKTGLTFGSAHAYSSLYSFP